MGKIRYTIIDNHNEEVGHLLIDEVMPPSFQHVAATSILTDGPIADSILFGTVLLGFTVVPIVAGGAPGWVGATIGVTVTSTLAGIKAWRGTIVPSDFEGDEVTIKVESWQDDNRIFLEEIHDKSISLEDWRKVGKAVSDGTPWSRSAICSAAGISQTTFHKIKRECIHHQFIVRLGSSNRYSVTPLRGMRFFEKAATLPY